MDKIDLPEYEVAPLEFAAQGLRGMRLLFVNVYTISNSEGDWALIDAGIPFSADRIRSWTGSVHGQGVRPRCIIMTHGHFDHAGAVEDLSKTWDVPVYAHPAELPYLTGKEKYPPPNPGVGGGLMSILSPLYPRGPYDVGPYATELPGDGTLPGFPEWKWLFTPGHTRGHVSFFRESDRCLLVGDAFCTTDQQSFLAVARQKPELHGPPAYYTPDWDQARESVRKLAALDPNTVAPGHGLPMSGAETAAALRVLAANFDAIARPAA